MFNENVEYSNTFDVTVEYINDATVIVDEIFETFPQVSKLKVEIEKPSPPIKGSCMDGVSVRINRSKT